MNSGLRAQQKKKMLNTYSGMKQSDKIYVAGHSGLVGSALVRLLQAHGFINLITRSRAEVDLRDERAVRDFFAEEGPEVVVLAAAKVGGIKANMDAPVEFLIENLQIQNNVIRAAQEAGTRKLLFLGSSCIYPKRRAGGRDAQTLVSRQFVHLSKICSTTNSGKRALERTS
jgi:Nucleoside-diphosphate-sugar epimerases